MRRSTAADQIKELILARGLQAGDPLPTESELCDTLDVSRSSVREAIRSLATLDIVEVRHGHGTFVGRMSLDPMVQALVFRGALSHDDNLQALRDVVEIRQALDVAMAEQVVASLQGQENAELHRLADEMVDQADQGNPFLEADRAFHTTLLAGLDNQLAGQLVGAFWDVHTAVLPRLGLALPADLRKTARSHRDILVAAEAGDVEAFCTAVGQHYEPLARALKRAH
ncbi:GntR family transcriptional regulator [Nocardioides currus]|uniref:GntR family transcriptional regulator n=2 Tax=Nocardioides currus TaxID=2133958 RepID=A0A2R7YYL4_9ACTN|nr:GntR family transcriptional regulator [Nocardioides currus]